ncbi:hypothetical protein LTR10_011711 [Elasticomyces elasticus]|uniref:Uncharacterized protein n=1 Tax=Exophiala sideris TaxID=1016849 RepID=A0ABR0JD96_9EURO|nr:hypothetical protein LTR10_011711 [Elasticomyces elasticus]KAK5031830.1 hypothetical protein LTS07_004451 [Exophiala sideris]KAK5040759.1 hypothetical protein LTR13_003060 [Exophiala sideris]KAK5061906.1 hypothetical protein LTR69_005090 [Exophiala sideris]KAK5184606.1 hypothetical protein LTR44_003281 [Eurotiomycetes sp. CCFEE 6388]
MIDGVSHVCGPQKAERTGNVHQLLWECFWTNIHLASHIDAMGSISNDVDGSYARTKKAVSGATADGPFVTTSTQEDPYSYQTGFGNRFSTEAV